MLGCQLRHHALLLALVASAYAPECVPDDNASGTCYGSYDVPADELAPWPESPLPLAPSSPPTAAPGKGLQIPARIPVAMEPPVLHIGPSPLCMPDVGAVELINTSPDEAIELYSASSKSEHFHTVELKEERRRVAPGGRVNISVVFVPRALGDVNGTLLLQTSHGGFFYQLHAAGAPSPYELEPLVAEHLAVGEHYEPALHLRNPHDEPLRIKEVYTSESFLHLGLPPSALGADGQPQPGVQEALWQVAPRERKHFISLSFVGDKPGRYQGYVHVLTDRDNLVAPVDFTAVAARLRATRDELDFGVVVLPSGGASGPNKTAAAAAAAPAVRSLPLELISLVEPPIAVTSIKVLDSSPSSPPSARAAAADADAEGGPSVRIEPMAPSSALPLPPRVATEVGRLQLLPSSAGRVSGVVAVTTTSPTAALRELRIPFRAQVVHGSLGATVTHTATPQRMGLRLHNRFAVPVTILGVTFEDERYELLSLRDERTLQPAEEADGFGWLRLALTSPSVYTSSLTLHTNLTDLTVPLPVFHMRLTYTSAVYPALFAPPSPPPLAPPSSPPAAAAAADDADADGATAQRGASATADADRGALEYGTVATGKTRHALLNVSNPNPAPLRILRVEASDGLASHLRLIVQTVRDEGLHVVKPAGTAALQQPIELVNRTAADGGGKDGRASGAKGGGGGGGGGGGADNGGALLVVPPRGRVILAAEMTAARDGPINGTLRFVLAPLERRPSHGLTIAVSAHAHSGALNIAMTASSGEKRVTQPISSLRITKFFPGIVTRLPLKVVSTFPAAVSVVSGTASVKVIRLGDGGAAKGGAPAIDLPQLSAAVHIRNRTIGASPPESPPPPRIAGRGRKRRQRAIAIAAAAFGRRHRRHRRGRNAGDRHARAAHARRRHRAAGRALFPHHDGRAPRLAHARLPRRAAAQVGGD